ncbi:MAG TPA: hypothetical protein VN088_17505 [Nocardioides sp.]|nr:hypothetical protein [Nocardioides sp.]
MRPLGLIGYGFLFVAVKVMFGRYDVLVDPLGWVLVLLGLRRLARAVDLPATMALTYLGILALLCSGPLWWPDTAQSLQDGDPAVLWSVGLGELLFSAVLCHALATLAQEARENAALIWFRICEAGLVIGALTPPLYFGAHLSWLQGVGNLGEILRLVVLALCFVYSGRTWAGAPVKPDPAGNTDE